MKETKSPKESKGGEKAKAVPLTEAGIICETDDAIVEIKKKPKSKEESPKGEKHEYAIKGVVTGIEEATGGSFIVKFRNAEIVFPQTPPQSELGLEHTFYFDDSGITRIEKK